MIEAAENRSRYKQHFSTLDGLRGLAVIGVLVVHYLIRTPALPTVLGVALHDAESVGSYGVHLFFVLSGFLITGILLDTRHHAHYFRNFYARRTLRILPLYYVVLALLFVVLPNVWPHIAGVTRVPFRQQISYWAYFSNFVIAFGDWGASTRHTPHFWTLAVEEQFYLVWPVLVLWLGGRGLGRLCIWLVAAALVIRTVLELSLVSPTLIQVATPCRLDALAVGALIAVVWRQPDADQTLEKAFPAFWAACGALVVLIVWRGHLTEGDRVIDSLGASIITILFGTVLAIAVQVRRGSPWHALLTLPPLRLTGRYSYGIYVLHYPIMIILADQGWNYARLATRFGSPTAAEAALVAVNAGLTLIAAVLSFHVLEQPFLALKKRFPYAQDENYRLAPQGTVQT